MAVADAETIGGGYRGADPALGVAHGCFQIFAGRKPCRDRRGQRAAGAVRVARWRSAAPPARRYAWHRPDSRCSRRPARDRP